MSDVLAGNITILMPPVREHFSFGTAWNVWTAHLDPIQVGICALVVTGVVIFLKSRNVGGPKHIPVPVDEFTKGHNFIPANLFPTSSFCSVCERNVVEGYCCDACGILLHSQCSNYAQRRLRCKAIASFGPEMKHHMAKGNLPLPSICTICFRECGAEARLCDFRCLWCKTTVHESCLPQLPDLCDLGRHRNFIIPPNCVKIKKVGMRPRRQAVVSHVRPPENVDWMPLIVIGNRKSGAGDSALVQSAFRAFLNPGQVIDVNVVKPDEVLDWVALLPHHTCRILVIGGDGTVAWILNVIEKLDLKPVPAVAILPIGTGNDLSNVLGWGAGIKLPLDMDILLHNITHADFRKVDRWNVDIRSSTRIGLPLTPAKTLIFNNYVSLGVDALVTLNFHRKREEIPRFFASRYMNKFLYFTYGTMDVLERACFDLSSKLTLECDGEVISLPTMEGLVFLNIPSWGAGVDVWNLNRGVEDEEQLIDDGYFEVFALYSSFHIAQMQVGLSSPHRLCRAKSAKLTLHKMSVPMQVDGEPFVQQGPSEIKISFNKQALMLSAKNL